MKHIHHLPLIMAAACALPMAAQLPEPFFAPSRVDKIGNSKWDNTDGHDIREVNTEGEMHVLVILANFTDQKFSVSADPRQTISDMLNSRGFAEAGATGSVRDYFEAVSSCAFKPVFDVYGPVEMTHEHAFYAGTSFKTVVNDDGVEESVIPAGLMIESACRAIDGEVDFSRYDANGDGMVDFVYVFHAGQGATTGGGTTTTVWPHAAHLSDVLNRQPEFDGVKVDRYVTSSELYNDRKLAGIGMFVHEFGHVLGLPDLYDTANNNGSATSVFHPGNYSTMAAGNYLNSMHTPPVYSSYERYGMEWMLPVTLTGGGTFTLLPLEYSNMAYKIASQSNPQEYFLFEARAPYGWDTYMPGHGMLVWHIDFDLDVWKANKPNNNASHQRIDLVEADNDFTESSRTGDPFPGSAGVCEYIESQSPAFIDWNRRNPGYSFTDIKSNPDGTVTFTLTADKGNEMEGAALDNPAIEALMTESATSARLCWKPVAGADTYRIALFETDSFDGQFYATAVDGYTFADLGDVTAADLTGLTPDTRYTAFLYACNGVNASRSLVPFQFATLPEDASLQAPHVRAEAANEALHLSWSVVPEAAKYRVVVTPFAIFEAQERVIYSFDKKNLSDGWEGNGDFETRDSWAGQAAPSYVLEANATLASPLFEAPIASMSLWLKQRFASDLDPAIDIYGRNADGQQCYIGRICDFSTAGETRTVEFPANVHGFQLVYSMPETGLSTFIDDVTVTFVDTDMDAAQAPVVETEVEGNYLYVGDLTNGQRYFASVAALDADGNLKGIFGSAEFSPFAEGASGITNGVAADLANVVSLRGRNIIPANPAMTYSVYALDGRCIAAEVMGACTLPAEGLYIIRSGRAAMKAIVK